jgi:hypothetical protein
VPSSILGDGWTTWLAGNVAFRRDRVIPSGQGANVANVSSLRSAKSTLRRELALSRRSLRSAAECVERSRSETPQGMDSGALFPRKRATTECGKP